MTQAEEPRLERVVVLEEVFPRSVRFRFYRGAA